MGRESEMSSRMVSGDDVVTVVLSDVGMENGGEGEGLGLGEARDPCVGCAAADANARLAVCRESRQN